MEKGPEMNQLSKPTMMDKVCLVTGATAGIGKITATALAAQGAELIIHGRNHQKTEDTMQEIRTRTGNDQISYLLADFSDLEQVRNLAQTFQERSSKLDILVNNAGAFFNKKTPTPYGVEMTFLVNHLAPFLLTNLLLETLRKSAPARIVNISSEGHRQGKLDFEDLELNKSYFSMNAYGRSKLANILFTYELARRLEGTQVTVNALHPGHIATDIWKNDFGFLGPILQWFMGKIALTPEEGAENSIYLASSPDVEGVSGKYFIKNEPAESSNSTYDEAFARKLWTVSAELTALPEL